MSENELVLQLYNNYSLDLGIYLNDTAWVFDKKTSAKRSKEFRNLLCYIEANKFLISYYKKQYNFKVLYENKGYDTYMYSKLSDVVDKCKPLKPVLKKKPILKKKPKK
jgi:hypothetical protein